MMKKLLILTCVFALCLTTQEGAWADSHKGKRCSLKGGYSKNSKTSIFYLSISQMNKMVDLDENQIARLHGINMKYEKKMLPIKEQLIPLKIGIYRMTLDSKPDMDEIDMKLDEIAKLKSELMSLKIQRFVDYRMVLKPSQYAKLKDYTNPY